MNTDPDPPSFDRIRRWFSTGLMLAALALVSRRVWTRAPWAARLFGRSSPPPRVPGRALSSAEIRQYLDHPTAEQAPGFDAPILMFFYATWCGSCRRQRPQIEAIAQELSARLSYAAIDGEADPWIAPLLGIQGFPTLYFVDFRARRCLQVPDLREGPEAFKANLVQLIEGTGGRIVTPAGTLFSRWIPRATAPRAGAPRPSPLSRA